MEPTQRDFTRHLTLSIIRDAKEPMSVADIATLAIKAGSPIQEHSFSPSLTQWFKKADKGWQHVKRRLVDHRTYVYWFDGGSERKPERNLPVRQKTKQVAPRTNGTTHTPTPPKPKEVFAKIVFNEGGVVVAVDQDFNVIKGAYIG